MKIIYIGSSSSSLSLIPLQTLINSKHTICALAVDDDPVSDFNVINSNSIQSLAFSNSIPVIKIAKNQSGLISKLQLYKPDIILVSCYGRRLSVSSLSTARKGSFNVHPSLLPAFRGPNPLFWQFRQGVYDYGITIHRLTEEFDAGNIVAQKTVNIKDGINKNEATTILANASSDLILKMLDDVENESIAETLQNNQAVSYQSFPNKSDYMVSTLWNAKRIYNFIKAYKGKGVSFLCYVNNKKFKLIDAYSYQEEPYKNMNGSAVIEEGELISFSCKNSYIKCQVQID
ncbi:MAG: formyltransferase family protein [Gammaproteobacteria bacterium]|nr:formyltransferase family protein [Gammaproteobacteria bacterium]